MELTEKTIHLRQANYHELIVKNVRMSKHIYHILYFILFSGLGFFSYLLLTNYTVLPAGSEEALTSVGAPVYILFVFNILGFSILQFSNWINRKSPLYLIKRTRIIGLYMLTAMALLLLNYAFIVLAKMFVGAAEPFVFPNGGSRMLFSVWLVELVVVGLLLVNQSILNSLALQKKAANLQEENNRAKYVALQNQMNPHFLFNSLNTLIAEIEYDPQSAVVFTRNLSDVYRYVLQSQHVPLVMLKDEIDFVHSYVALHQVRLGNCIDIIYSVADTYLFRRLPPLTLQLLIENVIKHNSINTSKPMLINIKIIDDMLVVTNPVRPKRSVAKSGTGLQNLSNRYLLLTGRDIILEHDSERFTVKVPLLDE